MKTTAPLSKTQYGIYAECVGYEGEARYNLPYMYVLDGGLDGNRLAKAIEAAVAAHSTLFTHIELRDDGEPQQTVDDSETFTLAVEEVDDIEAVKKELIQPFNLYNDRLFHIRLLHDSKHYYMLLDVHHIIADYMSLKVLLADIEKSYKGRQLDGEMLTQAQVATQEAEERQSASFDEGKKWYGETFDCGDLFTQLMPDLEIKEHAEASMVRTLDVEMAEVERFCGANGLSVSTFFTSAYGYLLAKYNSEKQSLFATIYNGRSRRFMRSVGMAVKTLPVYTKFEDATSVVDFLKAGEEQMSGCRQHDIYSFSDVMQDLALQYNSVFAWHGKLFADEQFCDLPMKTIRLCNSTLDQSLYLKAFILNGKYQIKAEYNSNEYSEALISQFLESYEAVVNGLPADYRFAVPSSGEGYTRQYRSSV